MPLGDGFEALKFGGGDAAAPLALPTTNLVMRLQPELAALSGSNVTTWTSSAGVASVWTPNNTTGFVYSATGFSGQPGISQSSSRYLNGDITNARALLKNVGWALIIMAVRLELQGVGDYLFNWTQGDINTIARFGANVNSTVYRITPQATRLDADASAVVGAELPASGSLQNTNLLLAVEVDYAGTQLIRQAQNSTTLSGSATVATAGLTENTNSTTATICARNQGSNVTDQMVLGEIALYTAASKPATSPLAEAMLFYGAYYGISIT